MDHTTRTIIFGVLAVVSVSMAFAFGIWSAPKDPDQFSDEGTPFFPDFADPFEARVIEVSVYNEETDAAEKFRVEFQDGVWRIPTHYNYPADGQDQLAKTARSVIGILRDSLQSESKDDHQGLGVVDPLNEEVSSGKGRGTHVRLLGEDDVVLVDYIIGKRPNEQENRYYIRKADEDRTYLSNLDIQLSTKFTDWIEPDLLQVERNGIVELFINDYSVVETPHPEGGLQIGFEPKENVVLTRESGGFQWALEDLDEASESIKTGVVNAMLTALDDLKIVGVRPKPEVLQAILRGEQPQGGPLAQRQMESDMASKGYYLLETQPGLLSNEGALIIGTDEGVSYQLLVGNVFVGSQNEIEIGGDTTETDESTAEETATDPTALEGEAGTEEELAPGEQRSRYLFILTSFDEELLGPKPEPPVMPTPPELPSEGGAEQSEAVDETATEEVPAEETTESETTDPSTSEVTTEAVESETEEAPQCDDPAAEPEAAAPADDPAATEEAATTDAEEPAVGDEPAAGDDASASDTTDAASTDEATTTTDEAAPEEAPAVPTAEEMQAVYELALQEYEAALIQYEADLADYNERLEAGQKKVDELQNRFAEWYYVIPADVFEDLDVSRADLVGPKTDPAAGGTGGIPDFNLPGIPGLPEGHPLLPESSTPDPDAESEAEATDPTAEEETAEETPEATEEATPEAESNETTESADPDAASETPEAEAEGSQSSESDQTPAPETDSADEVPTMEDGAATPE